MSPLTISVPILGALSTQSAPANTTFFWLGIIGFCAHYFGFALNDLFDQPIDRHRFAFHPLQTKVISQRTAWILILVPVPLALAIDIWQFEAGNLAYLGASIILSGIYNRWSKVGWLPRWVAEGCLALSITLLCFAGSRAVTAPLSTESVLFAVVLGLILLLINSVPSGLKDLKTDAEAGGRSFVLALGSRVEADGTVILPQTLKIYAYMLQSIIVLGVVSATFIFKPPWAVIILIGLLLFWGVMHLRMLLHQETYRALRWSFVLLGGTYCYIALALTLYNWMPLGIKLFYWLLIFMTFSIPLRLGWIVWRRGYRVVE